MHIIHFDIDEEVGKYLKGNKTTNSILSFQDEALCAEAECISIGHMAPINQNTLARFPRLRFFITRSVGMDHIDLAYCKSRGIEVRNIPDYGSFNIAEHAFALLLTGTRNILETQPEIHAGKFTFKGHLAFSLKGKTIGIVGTGRIGLEMIKRAKGFEMEVMAYDVYKNESAQKELGFQYVELDELLFRSDVISLHAPLLESTRHMINADAILKMKDGVVLINTGRGELIDTQALANSIAKFRFVGLDVVEGEKEFSKEHPLLAFKNVLITPHVAFYSDASVRKIGEETMRIIEELEKERVD